MWTRHVPMEILCLDVKRKHVGQNHREGRGYSRNDDWLQRGRHLSRLTVASLCHSSLHNLSLLLGANPRITSAGLSHRMSQRCATLISRVLPREPYGLRMES